MKKTAQATAKVKLELEIYVDSTWGNDCSLSQIYKQAMDAAEFKINKELKGRGREFRIIGKPKVYAIIIPLKDGG